MKILESVGDYKITIRYKGTEMRDEKFYYSIPYFLKLAGLEVTEKNIDYTIKAIKMLTVYRHETEDCFLEIFEL